MIFRANTLWNFSQAIQQWIDAWLLSNSSLHHVPLTEDFRPYDTCPYIECQSGARMYDISSLDK
jgi:hypothetical protein